MLKLKDFSIRNKVASLAIKRYRQIKGFSFMEVLVVMCAVVALSSGAFVAGGHILDSGRYHTAKSDAASISMAVTQYKFETGSYPTSISDLTKTVGQYGPWLADKNIKDPWGRDYNFSVWTASASAFNGKQAEKSIDLVDGLLGIFGAEKCYAAASIEDNVITTPYGKDDPDIGTDGTGGTRGNTGGTTSVTAKRFAVWSNGTNGVNDSGDSPTEFLGDDVGVLGR